jgi:excisionase family DNA binding protein
MSELLTTDEAAAYLRLSERKLYELVANGAVPCTKATGRWLFPKAALNQWVMSGMTTRPAAAPPIVGGSHDPLLEWALRESGSGLATLPEGSEAGLRRLVRGEVAAAAIHLHRIENDDETANTDAVASTPGLHDAVVVTFARREQGLLVLPDNPLKLSDIGSVAAGKARMAVRPAGAGAQLLLLALLADMNMTLADLRITKPPCPTGPDIAQAIRSQRADCGIATRSVARAAGLDFVPLTWEVFDLVLRQRDYFMPGPQALFGFMRNETFAERAAELGGYDIAASGSIRHVN